MSISQNLKAEIMDFQYKSSCCRRALLLGALAAKGAVNDDGAVYFNIENEAIANYLGSLVKEFFGYEPSIAAPPSGGRCKRVSFFSKAAKKFLTEFESSSDVNVFKCQMCKSSFLRGIFIACGRMTDPSKRFCLEFSPYNRVDSLNELFSENGIALKYTIRKTEKILYTKDSAVIEDLLALMELNDNVFDIINIKIKNSIVNEAMRLCNLDTININKGVDAAQEQIKLINELKSKRLLGHLPDDLYNTAMLRLEYPEMSLSRLAIHSVTPISKSGMSHRMRRLMAVGEELLKKRKR